MYKYGFKNLDRRLWFLAITRFIRSAGRVSSFIFLPLIFVFIYNISFLETGIFLGFAILIMSVVQFYSGRWTDKIGRRFFLIMVPFPTAVLYFLMFYVVYFKINFIFIVLAWYGTIISNAIQYPAIQASVADVTTEYERLSGYTLIRIMTNMGAAIGPLLGAILAYFNYSYIFLVASLSTIVEGLILYIYFKETYFPEEYENPDFSYKILIEDKFFVIFIIIGVLLGFALRQNGPALTLYAFDLNNLPIIDIGYIYSLNGLVVIALQMPILRLMSKYGSPIFWRGISSLFYAIGFALLAFSTDLVSILCVMGIFTIGEDFMAPTTQTVITTIAPGNLRGTYIGTYNLITSIGRFFGSFIGLYILYALKNVPYEFWIFIAILTLIGGLSYFLSINLYKIRVNKKVAPS